MTQLVQEYTVRAQVRAVCSQSGVKIDRTDHVANSLGHLAAVVDQLNNLESPTKVCVHEELQDGHQGNHPAARLHAAALCLLPHALHPPKHCS